MKLQGQQALCLGFVTFLGYLIFSHLEMYASPILSPPSLSLSFFGGEGGVGWFGLYYITEELKIHKYELLLYHLHLLMLLSVV